MVMRQFLVIWSFYKTVALWSMSITIILGFFNVNIGLVLITKAFLAVFLWYLVNETSAKRKLDFYRNFGVSALKLFSCALAIDWLISTSYLLLFNNFA